MMIWMATRWASLRTSTNGVGITVVPVVDRLNCLDDAKPAFRDDKMPDDWRVNPLVA